MQRIAMRVHFPFQISSRLRPSLMVGDVCLSLESVGEGDEGRARVTFILDWPDRREYVDSGLQSGVGGFRSPVDAFETFLGFLGHAAETSEDCTDMFPQWVIDWARENQDAIALARCEISDESGNPRRELIER